MKAFSRSGYLTACSFTAMLLVVELASRMIAPSLPVDPGKWPRIEIAQKLDQIRKLANAGKEVEVLFAGSSMMAGGVDPVAFTQASGLTSYNAAFAGPSMRTITPWILDVVEPMLDPDVVVVGVQTRELSDNGPKNQTMYEKFVNSPGYKQTKGTVASQLEGDLEELSSFLRYRRALREPSRLFATDEAERRALAEADVRKVIGPSGMRVEDSVDYRRSGKLIRQLYLKTLTDFSVGGQEYDALLKLARVLDDRDVQLVLVNMPVTADYWTAHADPDGDREEYHELMQDFVRETGVPFVDAENGFRSSVAFRDPVHLDIEGRQAMAEALAASWDAITRERATAFGLSCSGAVDPVCRVRSGEGLAAASSGG